MNRPVSVVMAVPQGFTVTGVTTWALSLTGSLAARGVPAALVIHGCAPGFGEIEPAIPRGVRVFRPEGLPPIEKAAGDVEPFARAYAAAAEEMAGPDGVACLIPMRHGDCFGACARMTQMLGDRVRVIGWQQNDSAYEDAIIAQYEPAFGAIVGVSDHITQRLNSRFPHRADEIHRIWNAARVPDACPVKGALGGRPIRIVYAGRLEHEQKRAGAFAALSDALSEGGINHVVTVIGDGPARAELERAAADRTGRFVIAGACPPDRVASMLADSDVFVMASRMEGLSLAMLEAMANGCAVVTTRTDSGAGEAVVDGETGVIVDADAGADDRSVGHALCDGVRHAMTLGLHALGREGWLRARDLFSDRAHCDAAQSVIRRCADGPVRVWPNDRPCAFSARPGAPSDSGTVPADGGERLARVLDAIGSDRIVIHGAGAHTHHLESVFRSRVDRIAAFADDNPASWGFRVLDRPVIAPNEARAFGATDVVISSFIHERHIWDRCAVYERQGIRVHRVYTGTTESTPAILSKSRDVRTVVASIHGPDAMSGVSTWGARMCARETSACDWRMIVAGDRVRIAEARSRWPHRGDGFAHFVSWDVDAAPTARIHAIRRALQDIGAKAVVGNYLGEGYGAAIALGLPTVGVAHAQHAWYREVLSRASTGLDAWWAVSEGARDRLGDVVTGVPGGEVVACGVPIGVCTPLNPDATRPIRVVYAGRLENVEKRVMDLAPICDALAARGVRFEVRIAGDGPAMPMVREALRGHIESRRVRLMGAVPAEAVGELLEWCDLAVLVSAREGMPVVVMEAMAAGRPVVITEGCGDAVGVVREFGCGAVVPVGAPDRLAEAISNLARDPADLRTMGDRARAGAEARCDIDALGARIDAIIARADARSPEVRPSVCDRWSAVLALTEVCGGATAPELLELSRVMAGRRATDPELPTVLPGRWTLEERLVREALSRARDAGLSRIGIFPGGQHTARIGRALADAGEVVVVIDDRPAPGVTDIHGRALVSAERALALGIDAVIVSSDQHEAALAARARTWGVPVLTLYGEPESITAPKRPAAA